MAPLRTGASTTSTPRSTARAPGCVRGNDGGRWRTGRERGHAAAAAADLAQQAPMRQGIAESGPVAMTATVRPPASSAPRCAAASMPRASPLTTTQPAAAAWPASTRVTSRPRGRRPPRADARPGRALPGPTRRRPRREQTGHPGDLLPARRPATRHRHGSGTGSPLVRAVSSARRFVSPMRSGSRPGGEWSGPGDSLSPDTAVAAGAAASWSPRPATAEICRGRHGPGALGPGPRPGQRVGCGFFVQQV